MVEKVQGKQRKPGKKLALKGAEQMYKDNNQLRIEEDLAAILEASVPKTEAEEKDDSEDGNDPPNGALFSFRPFFCCAFCKNQIH